MFDPAFYVQKYPDVAAAKMDPWLHYLEHGIREGRKPQRLIEPAYLQRQGLSADGSHSDPLPALLADPKATSHMLFDGQACLQTHPELDAQGKHPLTLRGRSRRGGATEGGYFGVT